MGGSEERCRASISRYPLEGYREHCTTDVTLGTR
jgi:hypothetical protein